jgi:DNA polymerase-3 subunit epsilon
LRVRLSHLAPDRPLCAIDLETTGPDPARDRVVEVGVVKVEPDGTAAVVRQLVHPGRLIPPAATAVHGIADPDVAAAPPFAAVARPLASFLAGADLAGFGVARFDLPLLAAEFARAGVPFAVAGRQVVDALTVFHRHEPRDLAAAVRFYLGRDHVGAHSAVADARAALAVLDAQVGRYGLPPTPAGLHARFGDADVAGQFRRGPDGGPVFGFGKHAGRSLAAVAATDPGYLDWLLGRPLLDDARTLVRAARSAAAGRRSGARGGTKERR